MTRRLTSANALVGAVGANIERDGRPMSLPVWPLIVLETPNKVDSILIPTPLQLEWRDTEDSPNPGRRRYVYVHGDADGEDICLLVRKVNPEHRDLFERLRKHWTYWFLVVHPEANGDNRAGEFFQVCDNGQVFKLKNSPEAGFGDFTLTRDKLIKALSDSLVETWRIRRAQSSDLLIKNTVPSTASSRGLEGPYPTAVASLPPSFAMPNHGPGSDRRVANKAAIESADRIESLGGPLPWKFLSGEKALTDSQRRETILDIYLDLVRTYSKYGKSVFSVGGSVMLTQEEHDDIAAKVLAGLRSARIFELTPESYMAIFVSAAQYTTERLIGVNWKQSWDDAKSGKSKDYPAEVKEAHQERLIAASQGVPFPEQMPFDSCYFAWGTGVEFGEDNRVSRGLVGAPLDGNEIRLVATLITSDGDAFDLLRVGDVDKRGAPFYLVQEICKDQKWVEPSATLGPWTVTALISGINEHRALINEQERSMTWRKKFQKAAKEISIRPIPPPYYTVYLHDQVLQQSARKEYRRHRDVEWSHRWDVRGHELVKIRRGRMPIDPRVEHKLIRRGYKVFTLNPIDSEAYRAIMKKGVKPPEPGEWIAVLISWREAFVKGPSGKPYVPSIRKPTKGMVARRKRELGNPEA